MSDDATIEEFEGVYGPEFLARYVATNPAILAAAITETPNPMLWTTLKTDVDRERTRRYVKRTLDAEESGHATDLAAMVLDRDALDELPAPEPLIPGVLERHAYALLAGRDGTYKTFIALDWCLCLATGTPWHGRPVERVKVLYMAGEGAYGLADRVAAWEAHHGVTVEPEWFRVLPTGVDLHGAADLPQLLAMAAEYGLIVLDTLRRVSGRADGNGSEMGAVVDNIDALRRATDSGTVLALAHTQKNDEDARGFSGIEDDADIVWHVKRDPSSDLVTLANRKMKNGPDGEAVSFITRSVQGSLVMQGAGLADLDVGPTGADRALLDALQGVFGMTGGASVTDLLEVLDMSKATLYRARDRLIRAELIESDNRRLKAVVSRPYETNETPILTSLTVSHEGETL